MRDRWREVEGEGVSVDSHLIVMGRELMEQLFDAVFLSWAVHIGHLVLRQGAVVLMNLSETQRQREDETDEQQQTCNMSTRRQTQNLLQLLSLSIHC